jgi:predicted nucleotidyltransferase
MQSVIRSPNRDRLVRTARRIAPLLNDVVFVGGQVTELLVTDPAGPRVRPTDDVDVIVRVASRTDYHLLQRQLAELGFQPDTRAGAPICRVRTKDELVLDVMPLDPTILGFTNRWYSYAIETAAANTLDVGLAIRVVTAPAFLATKWEAFRSRGNDNLLMSHDVEDIITLVAGRPSILAETRNATPEVRAFIAEQTARLLDDPNAEEIIHDALPDARHLPEFLDVVVERLRELLDS